VRATRGKVQENPQLHSSISYNSPPGEDEALVTRIDSAGNCHESPQP